MHNNDSNCIFFKDKSFYINEHVFYFQNRTLNNFNFSYYSCFIALWNSVVKSEFEKDFNIVYSHSLFACGIVQFVATLGMLSLNQTNKQQNYGSLLNTFGLVLILAHVPVAFIVWIRIKLQRNVVFTPLQVCKNCKSLEVCLSIS